MAWFFFALLSAVSLATADALTKRFFSDPSAYEMGLIRVGCAFPWYVLSLFVIPWAATDRTFWLCLAAGLPLEVIAFYSYMKAIRSSPLSLTLPFLAFTPGFIIFTGWALLGEEVTPGGFWGIVLIITGSYVLNLSKAPSGVLEPFRAIFREPGSRLMLLVSFIYAFTSVIGKLAILHSNPYFFGATYNISLAFMLVALLPFARTAKPAKSIFGKPWAAFALGGMVSLSMFKAAYMISIKRTSLLFGVLYGAWLFQEEKITERLTGAVIMLIGVFLISLYG
jgi:drug/metabolite transporter (DMT)-like permease